MFLSCKSQSLENQRRKHSDKIMKDMRGKKISNRKKQKNSNMLIKNIPECQSRSRTPKERNMIIFRRDVLKKRMESTDYLMWLTLMKIVQRVYWKVWGTLATDTEKTKQIKMNCLIINFRRKVKMKSDHRIQQYSDMNSRNTGIII